MKTKERSIAVRDFYGPGKHNIDNDTFYEIFGESTPVDFIELPRNRNEPYIGWQSDVCHWADEGKLLN